MSTEKSGPDESIKATEKVNNEIKEIVSESDDVSEKEGQSDLFSHHHHSHHSHHHHSYHRSDSGNTYNNELPFINSTQERSVEEEGIINEVTEIEDAGANSDTGDLSPKKRIPLAAHHRSHRHRSSSGEHHHHNSGEHHHRSSRRHHRSRRRSFSKVQYAPITSNEFRGHVETMGIDEEEFARLQIESLEEMNSKNMDTSNQESVADADRVASEAESETISNADTSQGQESKNSTARLGATILAAREANPRATRKASSVKSAGSRTRQKQANVRTVLIRILIGIAALLVGCIAILLIMRAIGQSSMTPKGDDVEIVMPNEDIPEDANIEDDGKTVIYKGQKYRWNDNLTTFLILGTDRSLEEQASGVAAAGKNGQADTILLAVIDNTNKKISFININRDTFIPVAEYYSNGEYAGEKKMQICLSYAYGKDNETSCKYTAEAVSKYLYGMPVDYFVRLSYDAIQVLNDSVGGVTLTVAEDLTTVDPSLQQGATVTLVGNQAMTYVRWRDMSIVETNENRISRQKQYLYAFMARTIECTRSDLLLPFGLFANAKPYMTTNVTTSQLTYITSKVLEYGVGGDSIHSIPGKSVVGSENHVEFYPDQTALYEQVLDTFYNKVA